VVVAAEGYPGAPRTGDVIQGIDDAISMQGAAVFGAGVAAGPDGQLLTAGGRVLNVCGFGDTVDHARRVAYAALGEVSWPGMHHRTDIAATT
jgi:phosphoribosylamine--glycine ligase